MRSFLVTFIYACMAPVLATAQYNIICTDAAAEQVMLGSYDPAAYTAATVLNHPDTISRGIHKRISADTLHAYLDKLGTFYNRNTASDTFSPVRGIGAARRWAFSEFKRISAANGNRLIASYLQFDTLTCGMGRHSNVLAVLPGMDTADKRIIIVEGHFDSRCAGLCDTGCVAKGIDDNGSGSALVLELARVMSKYSFNHTIVFALITGEEQGLLGAYAFANYAKAKGIQIKGVLNNDVVGGIVCGHTSSPPSCPGFEDIDSTHVRIFSSGGFNSFNKGLARFIKLEYKEMIAPYAAVPMGINLMTPEDRTGRGGDHIPFRVNGFAATRFTSANENGDASVGAGYIDHQHTTADSIGVDLTGDGIIDSFYVDFNYLARNTLINGNAIGMMGIGPKTPDFTLSTSGGNLIVNITTHTSYLHYRVGVRNTTNDWDSVYTFAGKLTDTIITAPATGYKVSVASVDANGVESLFSKEIMITVPVGFPELNKPASGIELLQNSPNPFDEATMITVVVNDPLSYHDASIHISDMNGRLVKRIPIKLEHGINEVLYDHGYGMTGTYIYTLTVDGKPVASRRMTFIN